MKKRYLSGDEYRRFTEQMPIATVDCVVLTPGLEQVLLGLRRNKPAQDEWYTPGGRIFKDEPVDDAVKRIVGDEIGVATNALKFHKVSFMDEFFPDSLFDQPVHGLNAFYSTILDAETAFVKDQQTAALRWFDVNEAVGIAHPYASYKIQTAVEYMIRSGV